MSVIVARAPYDEGSGFQLLANRVYLTLARYIGHVFGRSDDVISVYIRRSVAAGEVTLGLSDIDYGLLVRSSMDDPPGVQRLAALCDLRRRLKCAVPVLGEGQVVTCDELEWLGRSEPYRYSLNARAGLLVHGEPVEISDYPVTVEAAARRFIFWFESYLPRAIRRSNRRNLRKFALEMWNAWHCATRRSVQPFVTRRETELAWRAQADEPLLPEGGIDPCRTAAVCFRLAQRLHDHLLPPLARLESPIVFSSLLWPTCEERTFVILPNADYDLPEEAYRKDSVIWTPEALDLYINYCNPLAFWSLPHSVASLGIGEPSRAAFIRGCRMCLEVERSREPGFGHSRVVVPLRYWVGDHVVRQLQAGVTPTPPARDEARRRGVRMSVRDYYRNAYVETHRMGVNAREMLDTLDA